MDRSETLPAFSLRFSATMQDAKWDDGPSMAMLCLLALPKNLCNDIIVAYNSKEQAHSRPQSVDDVFRLAGKLNQNKRSLDHDGHDYPAAATNKRSRPSNLYCKYHGANSGHASSDCRALRTSSPDHHSRRDSNRAHSTSSNSHSYKNSYNGQSNGQRSHHNNSSNNS
ncbi:hypothetical protein, partial, partial [Absidia glauca]